VSYRRVAVRDVSFEIPGDWEDYSSVEVCASADVERSARAVLFKIGDPEARSLVDFAESYVRELYVRLPAFRSRPALTRTVASLPALRVGFSWASATGPVDHRLTFFRVGENVYVLSESRSSDDEDGRAALRAIRESLRLAVSA